jgi:hypothetical protein
MSYTQETVYLNAVNANMKYLGGPIPELVRYLGTAASLPDGAAEGVINLPIWTAMAAQSITDGTTQTNQLNNTYVGFTATECVAPISLTPKQMGGPTFQGENRVRAARTQAESIYTAAIEAYITALIAGTPTYTSAITTGYKNFKAATRTELDIMTAVQFNCAANRGGNCSEFRWMMYPGAYAAFRSAVAALYPTAIAPDVSGTGITYFGTPVIPVPHSSSTNWGGASASTALLVHPEGAPLLLGPVEMHGGGGIAGIDATYKWLLTGIYAHVTTTAMAQVDLCGELTNGAS